ncbi:NADH:flavin oxidoreductase [Clostridium putrefaciens]|uniref:NADH:flavin oxidoreductase n=1 Tax=Clostridium putrefaciens TaxID=99675 RepID=A0A381J7D1_9CLOT|nr:NADPH dehydrogenase NamA [Clostridium putrefaciens]SUY46226.1 NADH:flavin oxidoreductase [Clostridium putrefaciens]
MKIFERYKLKDIEFKNRIVLPPMCMYSADENGMAKMFHFVHYTERAIGGAGLIILEATAISPNGRISDNDLGIWDDSHIDGLKTIANSVKDNGAKVAIQLAHAGRKCEAKAGYIVAPSDISFSERYREPKALSKDEIKDIVKGFKDAAARSEKAGFDMIEIHGAHGYLINEFLSPLTNEREDEYGGSTKNRVRFLNEILDGINEVWPLSKPISLRVSASDYAEGGIDVNEMVNIINLIKNKVDIIHVSSGAVVDTQIKTYPGYQVKFAEYIKDNCQIPTIAVGLIENSDMVEEILENERADMVALGRELLRNPYWTLQVAKKSGIEIEFPKQYERSFK